MNRALLSPDPGAGPAAPERQLDDWLLASAAGDARAFEFYYNATVTQAATVVRRLLGDKHWEDVLADAYFQAWRQAAQFDPQRGSAMAWLLTLARSRALDRLRQEKVRHAGLAGAPEFDAALQSAPEGLDPETLAGCTEAASQLHAALAQLSAHERWVLALAYFRDCSHSEIASHTGLPLGTVKSLIARAQQKLRAQLGNTSRPLAIAS